MKNMECKFFYFFFIFYILTIYSLSEAQNSPNLTDTPSPAACVWDTNSVSPSPITPDSLQTKDGWTLISEGTKKSEFLGDAVFSNDKIAVVLRRNGTGAEAYARTDKDWVWRARLTPGRMKGDSTLSPILYTLQENTPGAVQFNVKTSSWVVYFRLTTGEATLEILPGAGMEKLSVETDTRYAIAPDFFGDDLVYAAEALAENRMRLPVENLLLLPITGGGSMLMCVWESNQQTARIQLSGTGSQRKIETAEIECAESKKIWASFLEQPSLWYAHTAGDASVGSWNPPFPAKWRMDFLKTNGGVVSLPYTTVLATKRGNEPFLLYPLDRDRATPLTVFCPIDIMRNTLGVGPCQYVLDAEKLGSGSHATPNKIAEWIEEQFTRKKDGRYRSQIEENLKSMTALYGETQARIRQYETYAANLRDLCGREALRDSALVPAAAKLEPMADAMNTTIAAKSPEMKTPEFTAQLAAKITSLIGTENAVEECKTLCSQLRALGAAQDYTLSKCRAAIRGLRISCLDLAEQFPNAQEFIQKVQDRIQLIVIEK